MNNSNEKQSIRFYKNDGTPYSFLNGPVDNGYRLQIDSTPNHIKMHTGRYLNDFSKKDIIFADVPKKEQDQFVLHIPEEVIKIHAVFFKKSYNKQRAVLRLLIWWSIKHYFKILFK